MKKVISYFALGMILVLVGCFIFVMNISPQFGKTLLLIGVLVEIFAVYRFFTRKKVG